MPQRLKRHSELTPVILEAGMQAAASRPAAIRDRAPGQIDDYLRHRCGADDLGLLDALPIAAAIFTLNGGKLWVECINPFSRRCRMHGPPSVH